MTRAHGRGPDELRPVTIEPGFVRTATGSALISCGGTRVICTASVQDSVPRWLAGQGRGWMTAEYGMLPASTGDRKQRDVAKGRPDGRTVEIQRLIGRSLRTIVDFEALGENTVWLDCDVLQADGGTRVICTASVQESVPRWMAGRGKGWMTAEYGMLPASTGERKQRDISKGKQDGRGIEIQRLIGRSLRGIADLDALGERTLYIDCDVLEADGGTRCAAITGGYVALALAVRKLQDEGLIARSPLTGSIAAVSCGVVGGIPMLDLDYPEDSSAEVDANVVMTGEGGLVEVQATAERTPLSRTHLDELLALAQIGIEGLRAAQEAALALP
jgi:ribonuclease PH